MPRRSNAPSALRGEFVSSISDLRSWCCFGFFEASHFSRLSIILSTSRRAARFRNGILVGSVLEGLLDRDLARFSVLHKGKGSIHYDVEGRRDRAPPSRTSLAISTLALAEPARSWGPPRADTRSHAAFLRSANRGVPPVHRAPAIDRHINIGRINLKPAEPATAALRGDQGRSRSEKDVEHPLAAAGHVLKGIGNESGRLHGRIEGQVLLTAARERVDRGIIPDVGPVASVAPELDRIEVRRAADPMTNTSSCLDR